MILPESRRRSGVLLHPTSLPGPYGSGDLGVHAGYFVDWLKSAGQSIWQMLPLGGVGEGHSPYMSDSAFAGNPALIDLEDLVQQGWLDAVDLQADPAFETRHVLFDVVIPWRLQRMERASQRFAEHSKENSVLAEEFAAFRKRHDHWLADYALFKAISERHAGMAWNEWPRALARREPAALAAARRELRARIDHWCFVQWCFDRQWQRLRKQANDQGISLFGDVPIFVALHSADVWSRPELFQLDEQGRPDAVAGVPPDYFSPTGQRWGNPLYAWASHAAQGYDWWIARMRRVLELVDEVRIDHFRGFAAYWRIPADATDATTGKWIPGPGSEFFATLSRALGRLPVVAEDLGIITPDVTALRRRCGLPGMTVLQFAWDGDPANAYLPHHHERDTVVYTGTHDNDTTHGWWQSLDDATRQRVCHYFGGATRDGPQWLMRAALASVADTAVLPMQDILGPPHGVRMNTPGAASGCWQWRFDWSDVGPQHAGELATWCRLYDRRAESSAR